MIARMLKKAARIFSTRWLAIAMLVASPAQAQLGVSVYTGWQQFARNTPAQNLVDRERLAAAQPDYAELIIKSTYRWEGDRRGDYRCSDTTRIAKAAIDSTSGNPIVFVCLRTVELQRQAIRALRLISLAEALAVSEEPYTSLYAGYLEYLKGVAARDVLLQDSANVYEMLCDFEYFVIVALTGDKRPDLCARPSAVERHLATFTKTRSSGSFVAPQLFERLHRSTGQTKQEVLDFLLVKAPSNDWARMWQFPVMHEFAHFVNCDLGPVAGVMCRQKLESPNGIHSNLDPYTASEVHADKWAAEALARMWEADYGLIFEEMTQIYAYLFVAELGDSLAKPMLKVRREAMLSSLSAAIRRAAKDRDLPDALRRQLERMEIPNFRR